MDGWITLGTTLDTKDLELKLKNLEKDLQRYDKEAKNLLKQKATLEVDLKEIEDAKKALKSTTDIDLEFATNEEQRKQILRDYEIQMNLLNEGYKLNNKELEETTKKIETNNVKIEQTGNEISKIRGELTEIRNVDSINNAMRKIGDSIKNITRNVIRWGIAIFGVRSAYSFVRQAMSTLSQYDDQLATDIEYIRYALAKTVEPLVKKIVEWAYQLLGIVGYIIKLFFGKDIFKNAGVSNFKKDLDKTNKSAKELNKTLASFDEMEILQDNNSGSSGGGIGTPATDLAESLKNFKPPKWLKWVEDHLELVKKLIIGIGIAFGALKLASIIKQFTGLSSLVSSLATIGVIAIGVSLLYTALTGRDIINDIKEIKKGLNDLNDIRKEQNNQAKKMKEDTKSLIKSYNDTANSVGVTKDQTQLYINTLLNGVDTNQKLIRSEEQQKDWLGALTGGNKKLTETQKEQNKIIEIQIEELKKLYDKGEMNNKQVALYKSRLEKQIETLQISNSKLNKNSEEYKNNTERIKQAKNELEKITGQPYIVRTNIQEPNTNPFKNKINDLVNWVARKLSYFDTITVGFGFGSGGGMGFRAKGGIYYPKLASGGIINMPGRGVPYHGATIGERGAEAVVPLTDSQQMALLGEAIGKYITVNATIVNSMNGRVLNRELQKIQNQTSFITNGR